MTPEDFIPPEPEPDQLTRLAFDENAPEHISIEEPPVGAPIFDENGQPLKPRTFLQSKPLPTFALPPAGDPSILIGDRWLNRGDLAILASTSGMGKSSLSLQAAVTWALGRPLFGGFKPNGPLRSILFQSEDSDGDIAEVWLSLQQAMRLTPDEIAQVRQNVLIVTDRIHRGLSFRAEIEHHVNAHKPDLVWINPLLAFIQGDVNQATDTGEFIRQQLNSLNEPPRFGYILIHHTSKPPKERKERQWNEVMYEMAGSADLTNAARAILALQATETPGTFKLVGAKRGIRAGLTHLVPSSANSAIKYAQPTAVIHLKHSEGRLKIGDRELPLIHWERTEPEAPPPQSKGGRPKEFTFARVVQHFPGPSATPQAFAAIWRYAKEDGVKETTLRQIIRSAVEDGVVEQTKGPAGYLYRVKI